jgi:hypothetical protein
MSVKLWHKTFNVTNKSIFKLIWRQFVIQDRERIVNEFIESQKQRMEMRIKPDAYRLYKSNEKKLTMLAANFYPSGWIAYRNGDWYMVRRIKRNLHAWFKVTFGLVAEHTFIKHSPFTWNDYELNFSYFDVALSTKEEALNLAVDHHMTFEAGLALCIGQQVLVVGWVLI